MYIRNDYDNCVYHKILFDDFYINFILYVNDMLVVCKSISEMNKLMTQSSEFEMKNLGSVKSILSMEIIRE